ncbi:MAG: class I mannose-6-phosphate isomerase, partial [Acholeplasmataceae bacterium]|nr:class I mannose-6-phosphate isomerase [Acholeplasmataceae bacterium]
MEGMSEMGYLNFKSQYEKNPIININSIEASVDEGQNEIVEKLKKIKQGIIVFETYPGVDLNILHKDIISQLNADEVILVEQYAKPELEIDAMLERNLTNDRVFGLYSHHTIEDFYQMSQIKTISKSLHQKKGLFVVYGFGASLIASDVLIQVSLTRWEIQLRFRKGLPNFLKHNYKEDILRKYKRGYFVEWRVADRIKEKNIHKLDYVIDYVNLHKPMMIDAKTYNLFLNELTKRPFRMVPYFDPGVWGGQWMKEVCNLDAEKVNYAWSFDGVPEENSIKFNHQGKIVELPAQDLVQFRPTELMGNRVHARFGKNFPIRFDLLDTMGGGNLSLQVHPLTEYIQEQFGMTYTQDESYYILDTLDDGVVYLGFKENIDKKAFKHDLIVASKNASNFPDEKYINKFKANKHDHFLIPAGTIHCSGKNTMVLEISACVYIFTFKLWDWERIGMDGFPRPVHLEHGFNSLQYDRDTSWVEKNLINAITHLSDQEEITGLHEREFLETRRYTFKDFVNIQTFGSVNVANLVSGKSAVIHSLDNSFEPYTIHYAETFI